MGRRVARVKEPGAATTVTPRHSRRSGAVDPSTLPFLPLTTQPAGGREVVLPGRRPDCPPSGRRHPQSTEQRIHGIWRHVMTRLMILMAALSLTMLSIILDAPRELWLGPPF